MAIGQTAAPRAARTKDTNDGSEAGVEIGCSGSARCAGRHAGDAVGGVRAGRGGAAEQGDVPDEQRRGVAWRRDRRGPRDHGRRRRHRPDRRVGGRVDGAAACSGRPDLDGDDHHRGHDRRRDAVRGRRRHDGGAEGEQQLAERRARRPLPLRFEAETSMRKSLPCGGRSLSRRRPDLRRRRSAGAQPVCRQPRQRDLDAGDLRDRGPRARQVRVGPVLGTAAAARAVHPQVAGRRQAGSRRSGSEAGRSTAPSCRSAQAESGAARSRTRVATPSGCARKSASAPSPRPTPFRRMPTAEIELQDPPAPFSRFGSEAVDLSVSIASKLSPCRGNVTKEDNTVDQRCAIAGRTAAGSDVNRGRKLFSRVFSGTKQNENSSDPDFYFRTPSPVARAPESSREPARRLQAANSLAPGTRYSIIISVARRWSASRSSAIA